MLERRLSVDDPEAVVELAADLVDRAFTNRLVATFTIGSLAHGGFSPLVSDVDLAVVLADPLTADDRAAFAEITARVHSRGGLCERLSIFWASPSVLRGAPPGAEAGRLPALDRLDLATHGLLLRGAFDLGAIARPTTRDLVVEGVQFAIDKLSTPAVVAELHDPRAVVAGGARHLTKRVLFPVRFLFTAVTHELATNEQAAAWYVARGLPAPDLVEHAARWRVEPFEPADAEGLVAGGIVAVYDAFLTAHIELMAELGEDRLAGALREWQSRLR